MGMLAVIAVVAAALSGVVGSSTRKAPGPIGPDRNQPAPIIGVDLIYYATPPFVLIEAFTNPEAGARAGTALRELAGVTSVRFSSHGLWSARGQHETLALRREVKLPNYFPWFAAERLVDWVVAQDFTIVLGINPEEGPEAAVSLVRTFADRGALHRVVAVELGNEPHLNHRPWMPEEYAEAAAAIIRALEPFDVKFAVPLTIGTEDKTPTGITDNDYTRRQLLVLAERIGLGERDDVYGVIHLYSRGVDPRTIDALNEIVRPFSPRMRYLITEYNIRSTLAENQQMTTPYALEFVERVGRLVAHPDVAGLYVHGVPYHSVLYWSGRGVITAAGLGDDRLSPEERSPGWHATPVGRLHGALARHLWRGEILAFHDEGAVQGWIVRTPEGQTRAGLFNGTDGSVSRVFDLGGGRVEIAVGPRSLVVATESGEVARVTLERSW